MFYSCYTGWIPHWVSKILLCISTGMLLGKGWEFCSLHIHIALYMIHSIKISLTEYNEQLATHCKGFESTRNAANTSVILMCRPFIAHVSPGNGVPACISNPAFTESESTAAEVVLRWPVSSHMPPVSG